MKIRTRRRIVEWIGLLIFISLPFLRVGGESALRFDVPTLKLHFFGTALWLQEFFFVFLAVFFFVALFLFLTVTFGRVWCGWLCPQTVFCDLTMFVEPRKRRGMAGKIGAHLLLMLISLGIGFVTVSYFKSPYETIAEIFQGSLGSVPAISMLVVAFLTYVNLGSIRRTFCSTICPYAKIQGVMTDSKTLIIQMDPKRRDECIDCKQCVRSCPTGVDIRNGMQVACIMCAECIDACRKVMMRKGKAGLIVYSFGREGYKGIGELLRPSVIIFGLATLGFFSALVYQSVGRSSFDFSVLPHRMAPRVTREGDVMNAYILSIKNKSKTDLRLSLALPGPEKQKFTHSITEELAIPAGQVEKFPLFIRAKGKPKSDLKLVIELKDAQDGSGSQKKTVYFNLP